MLKNISKKLIIIVLLVGMLISIIPNQKVYGVELGKQRDEVDAIKLSESAIDMQNVKEEIEKFVEKNKSTTAGLSVAVYDSNGVIYQNNFGYIDKENNIKVDENSVFEWGSTSKLLIWVSVMQLKEQGKIDLEEDIKNYLPKNFLKNLTYDDKITMLDLMNHQAGFQEVYAGTQTTNIDEVVSLEEALSKHQPKQVYKPGTVTGYSNWGAALAAYIVERISGMDYAEYVRKNIFEPLEMNHTTIDAKAQENEFVNQEWKKLKYYDYTGKLIDDLEKAYVILYPAGMGVGTMDDFVKFAMAITPNKNQKCVLFKNEETLNEMYTATSYYGDSGVPNNYHGFWSNQLGIEILGHGGNTFGSSAMLEFDPVSGIGMTVFVNQAHEGVYCYKMYELLFGKFEDSELSKIKREIPKGLLTSARGIQRGPMSIMSAISILSFNEDDLNSWWYQDGDFIYGGFADQFANTKKIIINLIFIILFAISGIYSIITIVFGGVIGSVIGKISKKEVNYNKRKWNYLMTGFISVIFGDVVCMFLKLNSGMTNGNMGSPNSYVIQSIIAGISSLGMIISLIYRFIRLRERKLSRKEIFTIIFSIIVLINVFVFELYAFWLV